MGNLSLSSLLSYLHFPILLLTPTALLCDSHGIGVPIWRKEVREKDEDEGATKRAEDRDGKIM